MGIGKIGCPDGISLKRHRFTFEGKDKHGNITFPKSFVKITGNPDETESLELIIQFDKIQGGFQDTTSGTLQLYDGCGRLLKEYVLEGIKFGEIDIVDDISYEKFNHIIHVRPYGPDLDLNTRNFTY